MGPAWHGSGIGVAFDPIQPGIVYIAPDATGMPNADNGCHMRGSPESMGTWDTTIDPFSDYHALLVLAVRQPDHCASPEGQPSLTVRVVGGVVDPHDAQSITVTVDPSKLGIGDHPATLHFARSDPAHPRVVCPVLVRIGDSIVVNGFDP